VRILAFTTCKSWKGPQLQIQLNAINSWKSWKTPPHIIVFGNDEGSAEHAAQLGIEHIPQVGVGSSGFPTISSMFRMAELRAKIRNIDVLMFANSDMVIVGMDQAAAFVKSRFDHFLLTAYRREVKGLNLHQPDWLQKAYSQGELGSPDAIDVFCFTRGLWEDIPNFVTGHVGFDNWLVMNVRDRKLPIVDGTQVIGAFHQDHSPRFLHRPDDQLNLKILAEHEGGGQGEWAPRGRLTDADWILARNDLTTNSEEASDKDPKNLFHMRQRISMALGHIVETPDPPPLMPGGFVDCSKMRHIEPKPEQEVQPPPAPEPEPESHVGVQGLSEPQKRPKETVIGEPVPDHRDPHIQTPKSARIQRIYDRCTDRPRPAAPHN